MTCVLLSTLAPPEWDKKINPGQRQNPRIRLHRLYRARQRRLEIPCRVKGGNPQRIRSSRYNRI